MKPQYYILTLVFLTTAFSCDRIKRKTEEIVDNAKDNIISHYDSKIPDTKWNKKRFDEFFHFAPTSDVKNIYCFADEIAFDHTYMFSFNCNMTTLYKIISELELVQADSPDKSSEGIQQDFDWWDKEKLKNLTPYCKKEDEHRTYWYLWYDMTDKKAYYIEFDM